MSPRALMGLLALGCGSAPPPSGGTPVTLKDDVSGAPSGLGPLVEIPDTEFELGHEEAEPGPYGQRWKENEFPRHTVTLSAFEIMRFEVTVAQWADFLNAGVAIARAHHHPLQPVTWDGERFAAAAGQADTPARFVRWYDAVTFCGWSGGRLPTEAEWELAAKGPDDPNQRWPWVEGGPSCELAVYFTNRTLCEAAPVAVGSRSPEGDSPWGLADMAGNVAEWTQDRYDRYTEDDAVDPTGPSTGALRVLRGGGFRTTDDGIRTLSRIGARPEHRAEGVGFRCVVDP